jgi:hypothetical protein
MLSAATFVLRDTHALRFSWYAPTLFPSRAASA